jgi:hypothetical protein
VGNTWITSASLVMVYVLLDTCYIIHIDYILGPFRSVQWTLHNKHMIRDQLLALVLHPRPAIRVEVLRCTDGIDALIFEFYIVTLVYIHYIFRC